MIIDSINNIRDIDTLGSLNKFDGIHNNEDMSNNISSSIRRKGANECKERQQQTGCCKHAGQVARR